ncbi:MAG TPA: YebC/PmpR family DNA-binding transcriptional regulator, partial [Alloiococcus sp.]|nr:YebC/PmpR family DNA-binding transcriptional regulator [Alloiococcus sp.]
ETSDEVFEIYTAGSDFATVRDELEKDFTLAQKELTMVPNIKVQLSEEDQEQLDKLVEALEDDDDVNEVYTNAE